jgi:hypothetical protein
MSEELRLGIPAEQNANKQGRSAAALNQIFFGGMSCEA